MKDPDLTWCLNRVKDAYFHLRRAGDSLVEIGNVEEGKHYLAEASKYIGKTKDMLNRYREFIKEDGDDTSS